MLILILAAAVILFFGSTLLSSWLIARPFLFLLYWGGCAWFTMTAVLLAVFDMCNLRVRARAWKKRLRGEVFGEEDGD